MPPIILLRMTNRKENFMSIKKLVFLCGFMGCGKSTIGKLLSDKLGCSFIDMDDYIVDKLGMSIPKIFSEKGEAFFRETETAVIKELSGIKGIIACGGGAMLKKENSDIASSQGVILYIDVDFETCYSRIKNDFNRPIVQNNTKDSLHNIYNERVKIYTANSSFAVNGLGSPKEIMDRILNLHIT